MIIREKVLIAIIITIAFLLIPSFFIADYYITLNHRDLEEEITQINTEQAAFTMDRQSSEMDATAKDWATWNDTYDYLRGTNPGYTELNIANSTFPVMGVNTIIFVDSEGKVKYDKSYDLFNGTPVDTPQDLLSQIKPGSPLIMSSNESNLTGMLMLATGPMVIAAYPVLPGDGTGSPAGTLIMGRYVDRQLLGEMAGDENTSITLYVPGTQAPGDVIQARESLAGGPQVYVKPLSTDRIAGYKLLKDIYGHAVFVLKVETDRPIYKKGNDAMIYFTGCVAITGVILSGLIVFLLESIVISRLARLHESVKNIGEDKNRSGRVPTEGKDELTELARSINGMLDALETSQKKLEEINAKYRSVNEELETRVVARTAELKSVNEALNREIAGHREAEADLIKARAQAELYLDLMGHDIGNLNQIALGYLELAQSQEQPTDGQFRELIDKPVEALKSSNRLINNVRKLQLATEGRTSSSLIDLDTTLARLREEYSAVAGRRVIIRYEPKAGCMVYADELLGEVFSNLIGNAIKHTEGPVMINLSLTRHEDGGKEYYVVAVEDYGPGIPDSQKGLLFSRVKKDPAAAAGKGLGLYLVWTLVNSYKGKVWVEDRVPGDHTKGSRFLVMLPVAEP